MNIFQTVKESVTARQAAGRYGFKVNRNGMICCPFHNDRHPSMKVDKGFCCFACGAKGDVITLAADLFHLSPLEAAKNWQRISRFLLRRNFVKRRVDPPIEKRPKEHFTRQRGNWNSGKENVSVHCQSTFGYLKAGKDVCAA